MFSTIARPYSIALFAQAKKESKLDEWVSFLNFLVAIVGDTKMQLIIASPQYSTDDLQNLMIDLLSDYSDTQKNFTQLLVINKRLNFVIEILAQYEVLKAKHENKIKIEIISAYKLSKPELKDITKIMERKLDNKIEINQEIDASLLGGVIIRAGDSVVNASVLGNIEHFTNTII